MPAHRQPLTHDAILTALSGLPGWSLQDDALVLETRFQDFSSALAFLVRVGVEAERLDHHPELFNVYNRVRLRLNTHDAGNRVTALDLQLAGRIQTLLPRTP